MIALRRPPDIVPDPNRPRRLAPFWLACAWLILAGPVAGQVDEDDEAPLRPTVQISTATPYVGQAIEIRVSVVAGGEPPSVTPPETPDLDLTLAALDVRQVASSAIGGVVDERVRHFARFLAVPRRAGEIVVPPFRVRLGDRSATTRAVRLRAANPPLAGRPAGFLGGVGPFAVEAEAEPAAVRVGQCFEYRLRIVGPAARGSTVVPDLSSSLDRSGPGIEAEALPADAIADPPSRAFRWRVRPTRAGTLTLPPMLVAAFDPAAGRYFTRSSPAVSVRVEAVAGFDPTRLDYGPPHGAVSGRRSRPAWAAAGVAGLAAVVLTMLGMGRLRGRGRLRSWARRAVREVSAAPDQAEAGRRAMAALVEYLAAVAGRPTGALTPGEARYGVSDATGRPDLAGRAAGMVEACDRAQFDRPGSGGPGAIAIEFERLARDLARLARPRTGGPQKPREAHRTAES